MGEPSRVTVIVVNYCTPALTLACIESVRQARVARPGLRAIVVDGGSGDGSAEALRSGLEGAGLGEWVELLALPINGGFGYANNQALMRVAEQSTPPAYVCLLNPDAKLLPGAIERLAGLLDREFKAGAVGARLQGADGRLQGSAFSFPTIKGEFSRGTQTGFVDRLLRTPPILYAPAVAAPVPWVTGAAVMLRLSALAEVGLFDDGFFLYFEEVELMHRLHASGWQIWHQPDAHVEHIGGGATDVRWDESGFHKPMPLPRYWYESRRRYLVRTRGIGVAWLATILFLVGRLAWLARTTVQRRRDGFPSRTSRDTVRFSLWPSRLDRARTPVARLNDRPGLPPLWARPCGRGH